MGDGQDDIVVEAGSPVEGDSVEDWAAVRERKFAAARERADRIIADSRARRQAALEGQLEAHDLAREIREAVDEPGITMSPEEAIAMLEGFGKPRH